MIKCPKCNELIGEKLTTCPMCKTEFTESELFEIEKQMQADIIAQAEEVIRIRNEFQEKRRKLTKLTVLAIGGIILAAILFLVSSKRMWFVAGIVAILSLLGAVAVIIWAIMSRALVCPFCESFVASDHKEHCTNCGERLR